MKSFICSVLVLILVILGICYYEYSVGKYKAEIDSMIKSIEQSVYDENIDSARKDIDKLNDRWDKIKNVLMMFNDHKDLNEMSQTLRMLKAFSEFEEYDEMYSNLETFKLLFSQAVESSKPTLANIL